MFPSDDAIMIYERGSYSLVRTLPRLITATRICLKTLNVVRIGLGNNLSPDRRHPIIWTNTDPVYSKSDTLHLCYYASNAFVA